MKVKDGSSIGQAVGDASLFLAPVIFFMFFPTNFFPLILCFLITVELAYDVTKGTEQCMSLYTSVVLTDGADFIVTTNE
jgi:hypothetical protein